MKVHRYKKARKILHSYALSHHIIAPFKVAVDGEFIQSALSGQIMLKEQVPKLLQEERTTVYTTPCVDNWLRLKGNNYAGARFIAGKLAHLKCRHEKGFVRPFDCIRALVANGNPDRLLIGAQDEPIRKLVRHMAGVPLLFIHGSTVVLEAPSVTTHEEQEADVKAQKAILEKEERKRVEEARHSDNVEAAAAAAGMHGKVAAAAALASSKKKRKGPKQPNPLSVKKKKTPSEAGGAAASVKKEGASAGAAAAAADAPKAKRQKTNAAAGSAAAAASTAGLQAIPAAAAAPSSSSSAASAAAPAAGTATDGSGASSSAAAGASAAGAAGDASANGTEKVNKKRPRTYKKKVKTEDGAAAGSGGVKSEAGASAAAGGAAPMADAD